jgi:hypothetical protein
VEVAWAFFKFGFDEPAHFRLLFSGILGNESSFPELATIAEKNFPAVWGF